MKKTKQNINGIRWDYWRRFGLTFLLGIGLVFFFSILVSYTNQPNVDISWPPILEAKYLSLTIAGALGGILYSILLDGALELPTWENGGKSLKPGFIGEVFVGIGGAFTAYIFIPAAVKAGDDKEIIIFVIGMVGGYGGKAILNAALNRVIKRIDEADLVAEEKERLAQQVDQLNEDKSLIKLVNRQINEGLPSSEVYVLSEKIKNASEDLKQQVFMMAKDIRRLSWRTKAFKSQIPRTIPIFQALVDSAPKNDQYHAQLAYAYKDSDPPRLDESISHLNQAIQLRGTQIVGTTWKYELNRALARIIQEEEQTTNNSTASPWREEIFEDLLIVDRNYGLAKVLIESEDEAVDIPLKGWLEKNEDWIKQRRGGSSLLEKAFKVSQTKTPQSPKIIETVTSTVGTSGSRRSIAELKASTSGSVSTRSLRKRKPWSSRTTTVIDSDRLEIAPPNTIIKAIHETYLKKQPIDSSELLDDQKVKVSVDKEYTVLKYSEETDGHYLVELDYGAGIWYIWLDHWHLPWEEPSEDDVATYPEFFTQTNLKKIMPNASSKDIATYVKPLNKVLHDFEINTAKRAAAFIAQIAHESGSLRYKEEIASGAAYEGRKDLGNTQPGDGKRYKGRGLIQLTGRSNYRQCGKALGLPLEENPQVVVQDPYTNAAVAGWYWQSRNINAAADAGDFRKVTKLINGGYNGYPDRCQFWERAKKVIPSVPSRSQKKSQIISTTSDKVSEGSALKHDNPAVQRQIDRLTKYLPAGKTLNLDLKTRYFSQRDNYRDSWRTCNSSSNAMYLDWLLRVTGKPGLDNDDSYIRKVFAKGDTIYHGVQTETIKEYGFNTKWMGDRDLPFVKDLVDTDFPVVVNILHKGSMANPSGGHIIMLIDRNNGYWIAHDPWGTLESKYKVHNGSHSRISEKEFNARWQGGYRILS
ncbi:MAG: glycoside hydrolase family 19 protein [Prochloraceae cyanobacterium]